MKCISRYYVDSIVLELEDSFRHLFWEGGRNAELNFTADVRQHLERTVAHVRVVLRFRVFLSLSALSIRWFDRMKK